MRLAAGFQWRSTVPLYLRLSVLLRRKILVPFSYVSVRLQLGCCFGVWRLVITPCSRRSSINPARDTTALIDVSLTRREPRRGETKGTLNASNRFNPHYLPQSLFTTREGHQSPLLWVVGKLKTKMGAPCILPATRFLGTSAAQLRTNDTLHPCLGRMTDAKYNCWCP